VGVKAFCGARRSPWGDEAPGQGFILAQSKVILAERAVPLWPVAYRCKIGHTVEKVCCWHQDLSVSTAVRSCSRSSS
jgi:hypothetical protein